jgi:hypothetical protein
MIQLNGISSFASNATSDVSQVNAANPEDAGSSFQSQLAASFTAAQQQFGINLNNFNPTIAPIVSASTPPTTTSAQPKAMAVAETASATTSATTTPADSTDDTTSVDADLSADAAYWASQPPAVQALQNIDDPAQRAMAAAQLAASGYTIDTPIMVWGWDPSKVTTLRQDMGYTWVPSAFQSPIAAAPGLSANGAQPYDPNNPPTGSIAV